MQIRPAEDDDLEAVVRLHREAFKNSLAGILSIDCLLEFYRNIQSSKDGIIYVAGQNNEIAGFIAGSASGSYVSFKFKMGVIGNSLNKWGLIPAARQVLRILKKKIYYCRLNIRAELISIAVSSEWSRRGIGRQLLRELERFFISLNVRDYYVCTGSGSPAGLPFYQAFGFFELKSINLSGTTETFLKKVITREEDL